MRSIIAILIVLLIFFVIADGQGTRKLDREKPVQTNTVVRTALVIGNGRYADTPLKNPPNDATDMATALKTLGFEVFSYTDLDQNGMKRAIREFGSKLRIKGGVGLFYYAGHGVQSKGVNYLIPVGAKVDTEEEVEYESVEVGLVLAQVESANNGMNIVILDACRNNPFARSYRSAEKGLASIDAPSGTLLAYSTAPGSVASDGSSRNGLYTQELLRQIRTPGVSIENIFKQVRIAVRGATSEKQTPWESSSLTGDFYFSGTASGNVTATATPPRVERPMPTPVPTPVKPKETNSKTVKESMFTFELQKCTKSGSTVACDFTITNNDTMDKKLGFEWMENGRVFDDAGNQGVMDGWTIGNASGFGTKATLIPEVPVKARFRFKNVGQQATVLKRIELALTTQFSEGGNYATRDLVIRFTDVGLQ